MNDFTKAELISLEYVFSSMTAEEMPEWLTKSPLLKKLRYMIDNYCDHIWTEGSGKTIMCGQCGQFAGKREWSKLLILGSL